MDDSGHGLHLEPEPGRPLEGAQLGETAHPGITEEFQDVDEDQDVTVEAAEAVAAQARRNAAAKRWQGKPRRAVNEDAGGS
jgi:hypothetical protein